MSNSKYFYDKLEQHRRALPYWDRFYKKYYPRYQDHSRLDGLDQALEGYHLDLIDKAGNTYKVEEIVVAGYYKTIYGELIDEKVDGQIVDGWLISSPSQLLVYAFKQRDGYQIYLWEMNAPRQAYEDHKDTLEMTPDGRAVKIPIDLIAQYCDCPPIEAFYKTKKGS